MIYSVLATENSSKIIIYKSMKSCRRLLTNGKNDDHFI
jgi:hypothetical protein